MEQLTEELKKAIEKAGEELKKAIEKEVDKMFNKE